MYLTPLKTMLVEAVQTTFDQQYPDPRFRNLHCSIEYPVEPQMYPGCWVDYDDTKPLQTAGVGHQEIVISGLTVSRYKRWKFAGYVSFTLAALTSLERDDLYDEFVRVLAFGSVNTATRRFRDMVEDNDLIAANFDFDQVEPRGNAAVPGTPWGTDEIIYERTINMEVIGEFISDAETSALVSLSKILVDPLTIFLPSPPIPDSDPPTGWI